MEREEYIPPIIEPTPIMEGVRCKFLLYLIYLLITYLPLIVAVWIGIEYNIWIAIAFFLFLTLISGILFSKMRFLSIPPSQRELNYNNIAIIRWYLGKHIC